jgi:hypothetical protein
VLLVLEAVAVGLGKALDLSGGLVAGICAAP